MNSRGPIKTAPKIGVLAPLAVLASACGKVLPPQHQVKREVNEEIDRFLGTGSDHSSIAVTFLYLGAGPGDVPLGWEKLESNFQELAALKITTVILTATRVKSDNSCGTGGFTWVSFLPDRLADIMRLAARHGIRVWYTVSSMERCDLRTHLDTLLAEYDANLRAVWPVIKGFPNLDGVYIPQEPYLGYPNYQENYRPFSQLVRAIRAHTSLPIAAAPYLANMELAPSELARRATEFRDATGVNIQIWQDSVGASSMPISNWGRGTYKVHSYFEALSLALGRDNLWGIAELFNGPLTDFSDPGYRPTSMARLGTQIRDVAPYVARIGNFIMQTHLGSLSALRKPEAERLLHTYMAHLSLSGHATVSPTAYSYRIPPAPLYPDQGSELTDRLSGDPKDYGHSSWVGFANAVDVSFQLPGPTRLDWIGVHVLNEPPPSIYIPNEMVVSCLDAAAKEMAHLTIKRPFGRTNLSTEYVFSNTVRLGWTCHQVRLRLNNDQITFVSEVEFAADGGPAVAAPLPTDAPPSIAPPTLPPNAASAMQGDSTLPSSPATTAAVIQTAPATPTPQGATPNTQAVPQTPPTPTPTPWMPTPTPSRPSAPEGAPPQVVLVLAAESCVGTFGGITSCGVRDLTPGAGFAVGISVEGGFVTGDECRLDVEGVGSGVLVKHPGGAWEQVEQIVPPSGSQRSYCAYCYATRAGQWVQSGACAGVHGH